MKKIFLLSIFACMVYSANSQQLKFDWVNQAGGPGWDIVTDMAELSDKQIIIAGAFYDSIYFQPDTLISKGSRDIFIASYKPDGSFNKAVSFGGTGYDYVKKVEPSGEAGLVMPIQFNQELQIGRQKFKASHLNNFLIVWFDKSLNMTDYALIGSNGSFDISSLEAAPDGDFYFSGWFTDTLVVENKDYVSLDAEDIFLGKISNKGKLKWFKTYKGIGSDVLLSFITEQDNVNFMAGVTSNGCFESKNVPVTIPEKMGHLFISRINNTGKESEIIYPVYGYDIEPVEILKDSSLLWLLANFKYSAYLNGIEISSYGKSDVLLVQYNLQDKSTKYCQLGGFGNEEATGLIKSGEHFIITGLFTGKLNFAGQDVVAGKFGTDVFIASVNNECQPDNIVSLTGKGSEFPCSVFASESGIYLAGEFNNIFKTGKNELTSAGKEDIFLARIENCSAKNPLTVSVKKLDLSLANESWELDAGPNFINYAWQNNTSFSRFFTAIMPGVYSVEVTDSLGCVYTKEVNLPGTKSAKIVPEDQGGHGFRLYPSVTSTLVYWEPSTSWEKGKTLVRVFDPAGKEVLRQQIDELSYLTYHIDFSGKSEGTYVIEVSGADFREISKVIVNK